MKKNKNIFYKINEFLKKEKHEMVMSIFLENYNNNTFYIRFDYCPKQNIFKVIWFDFNRLKNNSFKDYINVQEVPLFIGNKLIDLMDAGEYESGYILNDKIKDDKVEIISCVKEDVYEFVFQRFLPLEWKILIDPIVVIFSYMPRYMEAILDEIFASFDKREEAYNILKPIKFDLMKDSLKNIFRESVIEKGLRFYKNGYVTFLEKVKDKYVGIVEGKVPHVVILNQVDEDFSFLWCHDCNKHYCEHIVAALLALRDGKLNNFYKVAYKFDKQSILDKIYNPNYNLCFGVQGDDLLLISSETSVVNIPIVKNNEVMFDVIEDDDECSLSKLIDSYKK